MYFVTLRRQLNPSHKNHNTNNTNRAASFSVEGKSLSPSIHIMLVSQIFLLGAISLCSAGCGKGVFNFGPKSCDEVDCSENGVCVMENGGPACLCDPGYMEVGLTCISEDGANQKEDSNGKADSRFGSSDEDPCKDGTPMFVEGNPICLASPEMLDGDRDLMPQDTVPYSDEVPESYSIRDKCITAVNQGYSPSCTAASAMSALSCHEGKNLTYSFWYLWDQYKFPNMVALSNNIDTWVPLESCYPSYSSTPTCNMELDKAVRAKRVVIIGKHAQMDTADIAVQSLAAGYVTVAACRLDSDYWSTNNVITDVDFTPDGGHAIALVGYEGNGDWILFLNSWGENWGEDEGYGRISREYFDEWCDVYKIEDPRYRCGVCIPHEENCINDVLRRCDADGCGFDSVGSCSGCSNDGDCGEPYHCVAGVCVEDVCPQGELFCDGNQLMSCNNNGSNAQIQENCPNGCGGNPARCFTEQGCGSDTDCDSDFHCSGGECLPDVCPQGEAFCNGNDLRQCTSNGAGSSLIQHCQNGCDPTLKVCYNSVPCNNDGDCSSNHHCTGGFCEPDVCPKGATFCSGGQLKECSPNGSSSSLLENCSYGCGGSPPACYQAQLCNDNWDCPWTEHCSGGFCESDVCLQGEKFCDGNTLMQCNYEGSGSSLIESCLGDCGGSPAACIDECTASKYWAPTFVADADYNADLDISLRAELMVDPDNAGINIRICRVGGEFAMDTIHVTFEETETRPLLVMTQGELPSLGMYCTQWTPLEYTQLWKEGESLGGDVQVVSPGYCGSDWGWGCTSDPGCGFCWFMSVGNMTRTCLE